jgi:hypothetical protein
VPNVLYERTVITNEQNKERLPERIAIAHAETARICKVEMGTRSPDCCSSALKWRHAMYRTSRRACHSCARGVHHD